MADVILNKNQAQQIAFTIFADIEQYIEEHKEEYEAFLLAEKEREDSD